MLADGCSGVKVPRCGTYGGGGNPTPLRFSKGGLSKPVLRFGGIPGGGAEILHQSCAGGFAGALAERVGRSFYDANFFGVGGRDPLVPRLIDSATRAIFFRQVLGASRCGSAEAGNSGTSWGGWRLAGRALTKSKPLSG